MDECNLAITLSLFQTYVVYLREYSPGYINDTTTHTVIGKNYAQFDLQRGGQFEVTVKNGNSEGKNSTVTTFSPGELSLIHHNISKFTI